MAATCSPKPGPEGGASGIAFTVPSDGVRVHSDRDSDVGRPARRPRATTLLEALLLIEAEAVRKQALAIIRVPPIAIDQRPHMSVQRNSPVVDCGPVHAKPLIFGSGRTIHHQCGGVLATVDDVEDIARAMISAHFKELTDSASTTARLTNSGLASHGRPSSQSP